MRRLLLPVLTASAVALTACGGDDSSDSGSATQASSVTAAATQAGETRAAIRAALETYRTGDKADAGEQVAEAYVSHFEYVEHELEEKDAALMERLEKAISGDLRGAIKAGDDAKVSSLGARIVADLKKAEALLR